METEVSLSTEMEQDTQVAIHLEIAAKINFACHQNSFPIVRDLRVDNLSRTERLQGLVVSLVSNPGFIVPKVWIVDRIAPNSSHTLGDRDITLDGAFLMNLTDTVRGSVTLRIEREGRLIAETSRVVELLAHNEWGGSGYMPELLASFCTPNDPSIDRILKNAADILRQAGKQDSIEGYQSGSRERVYEIASAIYAAIANLGLTYSEPPASFESDGQKIRLPGKILDARLGTCLDTAMLFASAFEQAGLHAVVALPRGHALAGVWLQPDTSGQVTQGRFCESGCS